MSLPRMSLHIGDYLKDTTHLDAPLHGAYLLLIMHYWAKGGLPDDDAQLAMIARMSLPAWRRSRPTIQAFFHDGWRHKRVELEIAEARAKYERRVNAGRLGGRPQKEKAMGKQSESNAFPLPKQPITLTNNQVDKSSEAIASDAGASDDPRTNLFNRGLKTLAKITGRTPDSCRALVGKWLKLADDEAVKVLGAIDDAERNRIADPAAWISRVLSPKPTQVNSHATDREAVKSQYRAAVREIGDYIESASADGDVSEATLRLLPSARCG